MVRYMEYLQVLAASDADADEENTLPSTQATGGRSVTRTTGSMATLSGADDVVYMEYTSSARASKPRHPLLKLRH